MRPTGLEVCVCLYIRVKILRVLLTVCVCVCVCVRSGIGMALVAFALLAVLSALVPGLGALEERPFVEPAGMRFAGRANYSILTVPNGGQFGNWTWPEMCPEGFYAVGFSLRVEPNQYGLDDTALNGIRLFCSRPGDRSYMYYTESHTGYFGEWTDPQWCPGSGVLKSFQLRVEPHLGLFGDDTSANNIRFRCSSNPTLQGQGTEWGEYGYWSEECDTGGICGLETKMEARPGGTAAPEQPRNTPMSR
ncbi:vitelline membrane outer layer protein 1-like [Arapaima gigas]